jgi:hypothetical protein
MAIRCTLTRAIPVSRWGSDCLADLALFTRQGQHAGCLDSPRPTKSTADFNCDMSKSTKPKGKCTSRRKIYYSPAHEWAAIIYPDDDGPAVADVCYPNLCSESESSVCGR